MVPRTSSVSQFEVPNFSPPSLALKSRVYLVLSYMKRTKLKEFCNFVVKTKFGFWGNHKGDFADENSDTRILLSLQRSTSTLSSRAPNVRLRGVMMCLRAREAGRTTLPAFYTSWPTSPGTPEHSCREPPGGERCNPPASSDAVSCRREKSGKKVKLHPPPLPPAPEAKVQREEEEGNGVGAVGAKGTSPRRGSFGSIGDFLLPLVPENNNQSPGADPGRPHLIVGGR